LSSTQNYCRNACLVVLRLTILILCSFPKAYCNRWICAVGIRIDQQRYVSRSLNRGKRGNRSMRSQIINYYARAADNNIIVSCCRATVVARWKFDQRCTSLFSQSHISNAYYKIIQNRVLHPHTHTSTPTQAPTPAALI